MTEDTFTIDAANKSLGRVASEAAQLLRGKNEPNFQPHILPQNRVTITNASKLSISEKKQEQKTYSRYTGYPGGLRQVSMKDRIEKKGYEDVVRDAVEHMIPRNKLRPEIMKHLTIEE